MKKFVGCMMILIFALGGLPLSVKASNGYSYKDRVYETPEKAVKIVGVEQGKDFENNPIVYVLMELTNKSKKKIDIYFALVDGIIIQQDTGTTTEDLNSSTLDEETSPYRTQLEMTHKKLNPNKTVEVALALDIVDEQVPVLFEFEDDEYEVLATDKIEIGSIASPLASTNDSSKKDESESSSKKSTNKKKSKKKKNTTKSKKSKKKTTSKTTKSKKSKKTAFQPKDVSDSTIEKISTYGDYLTMFNKIVENYLADYEKAIEGTALHDQGAFDEQKKQYDEAIQQQKDEYSDMKNKKIVNKTALVDFLKDYRNSLNDYIESIKSSLDKG